MQHIADDNGVPVSLKTAKEVIANRKKIEGSLNKEVKVRIDQLVDQMTVIGRQMQRVLENADEINLDKNYEEEQEIT